MAKAQRINDALFNTWGNMLRDGELRETAEEISKHSIVTYGRFLDWAVRKYPIQEYLDLFKQIQFALITLLESKKT